jgi:hypothetical protein
MALMGKEIGQAVGSRPQWTSSPCFGAFNFSSLTFLQVPDDI